MSAYIDLKKFKLDKAVDDKTLLPNQAEFLSAAFPTPDHGDTGIGFGTLGRPGIGHVTGSSLLGR